ncbi:hypothetical protein FBUS_03512 [Fasciolopsis buskii]|uniref:Uncharacterized protein n=1 Tax=Fasciolopsis buskii TaxID=27845 RepID=A0A8E0S086_9TREM|nr:hypothetical protein FBUS_03512 [Fasciolopsis buski]
MFLTEVFHAMWFETYSLGLTFVQFTLISGTWTNSTQIVLEPAAYCDAHNQCFALGQSKGLIGYMLGEELQDAIRDQSCHFPVWVNLHVLLQQTSVSTKSKWIYGEQVTKPVGMTVGSGATGARDRERRLAVLNKKGRFKPVTSFNSFHSFVCGFRSDERRNHIVRQEKFLRDLSRKPAELGEHSESTEGCFNHKFDVSPIKCAME